MKIELNSYIVANIKENGEIVYLNENGTFDSSIYRASKSANIATAKMLMDDCEESVSKDAGYGLKIMPLKVTYEW